MKTSTLCVAALLAASLLAGCSKLRLGDDADAAAEAGAAAPVGTPSTPVPTASATAEPSADPKRDPGGCKPGQLSVKLTEVPGGVESQKCRQVCGQGRGQCPSSQSCTGSGPNGALVCVNVRPGPGSCKPGDRLIQGSAATLFFCVTPCKADTDCPKQRPACGPELNDDLDNPALKFKTCGEATTPAPSKTAATTPSATTPIPTPTTPPPPPPKVKCVLPSPPPCAAPHVASPKGLCQLPCSNGSCAACGGTCQNGFCAGG